MSSHNTGRRSRSPFPPPRTAFNPLERVVYAQHMLKFAPHNCQRLATLATVSDSWHDAITNYAKAIFDCWRRRDLKRFEDEFYFSACGDRIGARAGLNFVTQMLAVGASPDMTCDGVPVVCEIAFRGHLDVLADLQRAGADANASDINGATPLLFASESNNIDCLRALIAAGANIDAEDDYGDSPIIAAAKRGHTACAEELAKKGAKLRSSTSCFVNSIARALSQDSTADCLDSYVEAFEEAEEEAEEEARRLREEDEEQEQQEQLQEELVDAELCSQQQHVGQGEYEDVWFGECEEDEEDGCFGECEEAEEDGCFGECEEDEEDGWFGECEEEEEYVEDSDGVDHEQQLAEQQHFSSTRVCGDEAEF